MESIIALPCDIWVHLVEYKERYLIIAAVFAFRSVFKWFLQSWVVQMEYEVKRATFFPPYRNMNLEFRNVDDPQKKGVVDVRELILSDLATRQFWSLFQIWRCVRKIRKHKDQKRGN